MGLSPVMEIWNVTDPWNLIEEVEGQRWKHGEKDERKHADKKGFLITSTSLCVQCVLKQRGACMCTAGVLFVGWVQVLMSVAWHVFVRLLFPGLCIYVYNHVCFLWRVLWCVWVAVHTHVSCWVSLVAVPHHCCVPPGLCCWLHSPLLFCRMLCVQLSFTLFYSTLLLKV